MIEKFSKFLSFNLDVFRFFNFLGCFLLEISRNSLESCLKNFRKILEILNFNLDVIRLLKFFGLFFLETEFIPKLFEQDEHVTDSDVLDLLKSRTSFRFPSIKVF